MLYLGRIVAACLQRAQITAHRILDHRSSFIECLALRHATGQIRHISRVTTFMLGLEHDIILSLLHGSSVHRAEPASAPGAASLAVARTGGAGRRRRRA